MELVLLFGLILLNGLFAMSEIALVTARQVRLQKLAAEGDRGAQSAVEFGEHPTRFLSTIQIGMTSIGILSGIVGEAVFATPLAAWIVTFGVKPNTSELIATALVVLTITYFSIILGEVVPKRIGQIYAEPIARLAARPMLGLAIVTQPFVKLLTLSTEVVLRLLRVRDHSNASVTQEEINAILEEGSDAGVIEEQEHAMVRNVFRLDDRKIASLMIPRGDIVYLDTLESLTDNLKKIAEARHSRFPVCRDGWREVLGIVSTKQLLTQALRGEEPDLTAQLQPAVFVPETLSGMELLENFRSSGVEMVLVIDEYGEVEGLVTLQDVLEAITGEFTPHNGDDAWAIRQEDGAWLLDGVIPVQEMKDRLALRSVPEEEKGRYHTLSGMLMLLLGRLPEVGDDVEWGGWRFKIVAMDEKRIDKVMASPAPAVPAQDDAPPAESPP